MSRGFSLIELAIVLGIITIMSSGIILSVRSDRNRVLENTSLALQADFRYAQRRAIMEGRHYGIAFDVALNRYRIVVGRARQTIRIVYLPNGVYILETSQPSHLMFLPRGTATGGFRVTLTNGTYNQQLTATVSGGRIRIFDRVPR